MAKVTIGKLTDKAIEDRNIRKWAVWQKEVSRFDWQYDSVEECYIIEGEVIVETGEGDFHIKPGDFVTFSKGLKCTWDIRKPIKKYYNFP